MAARRPTKRADATKQYNYVWEGKDRAGKILRGEMRAASQSVVQATLRRQGVLVTKARKQKLGSGGKVKERDIVIFTRQLATMMKAGVPLMQSFDIVGKGASNPAVGKLLLDLKSEVETGNSLNTAFRKYPQYFDPLYCNLIAAGEQAGILENLLDRLATHKEKILAIKSKIKGALFYPTAVVVVAFIVTAIIMLFVIPRFKEVFSSFGADLPTPTLVFIAISDFFVDYWYAMLAVIIGAIVGFFTALKRSRSFRNSIDRLMLRLPVFGEIIKNATIARWTRTLSTMSAAGVPLVESLDSVAGAAGNYVYETATREVQASVSSGTSLTVSMQNAEVFPNMVLQMVAIGEESGALDSMLGKVADFYEGEVDVAINALSSLLEPIIMVFLGIVIGGMVIAMYLPIFKMGSVV